MATRDISPHELVMPDGNAPSIYASPEEWAAYREEQARMKQEDELSALLLSLTGPTPLIDTGAGAGRGSVNPPNADVNNVGAGRGVVNPANVVPVPETLLRDPLAADENGHNLTRTDKVNTTGAMQRINAAAPKWYPGVTATMQENGTLSLSNIGAANSQGSAPVKTGPNISNDLFASINALKGMTDPAEARGVLSSIRESAAQKSTSLMAEAMNFASSKLGVPFLEQQLREAEAADRADPMWYTGIGDSPITAKIRQQLLTTRSSVDNEAKNYLATNTTFASMNAALKTAEEEAKRIDALSARKERLGDELTLRAELKKDAKVEEAAALRASLSPTEQKRLAILNPSIANEADPDAQMMAMAASIKRADRDPAMREALGAADQDLPTLAMSGNADALTLTISKEKENNPAATDESVKATLDIIARNAGKPEMVDALLRKKYGTKFDSPEAKAEKAALLASSVGLDAAGKKIKRAQDNAIALEIYRGQATDRFASNVASWGIQDPEFLAAQEDAYKTTGKRDLQSVITSYMKNISNDPASGLVKMAALKQMASSAAGRQAKSMFGTPDTLILNALIDNAARTSGLWEAIKKVLSVPSTSNTSMAPLGSLGAFAIGTQNYMNNRE